MTTRLENESTMKMNFLDWRGEAFNNKLKN